MRHPIGTGPGEWEVDGCCPGAYGHSPASASASLARLWHERGQLQLLYPLGVTQAVIHAVSLADSTRTQWLNEGARIRKEQAKESEK